MTIERMSKSPQPLGRPNESRASAAEQQRDAYTALQIEMARWEVDNFGLQDPWNQFLGMIEELGEFFDAAGDDEKKDALADILIFGMNHMSAMDADINYCLEAWRGTRDGTSTRFISSGVFGIEVQKTLSKMAHHHLKSAQGIRGQTDMHKEMIFRCFGKLWELINIYCLERWRTSAFQLVSGVWEETVSKRNWKENPTSG